MSLKDILDKYETGRITREEWFTLKEEKADCEGCLFNTDDPKHCLIYPAEKNMEKPQECKHKKIFREG